MRVVREQVSAEEQPADLQIADFSAGHFFFVGVVLPGGESTTISKGLVRHELVKPIQEFAEAGLLDSMIERDRLVHEKKIQPSIFRNWLEETVTAKLKKVSIP